ncbi:holo-ACP synthase [Lactimicrobium massiliense]|uniref:holo-ACP synthase n=1 Tax=Lactimicrobium massiliense TaxID=2161814 RepID=UPI000D55B622|nr:holo-ACP synthase [Lactimicrobium massiliense]
MTGIDIVQLSRIRLDQPLIHRILTEKEQMEYAELKTDRRRMEYLGGHFAAKEAIFKAAQDQSWLSYSILHEKNGRPYIDSHPDWQISIAHDGDYAIAIVIIP